MERRKNGANAKEREGEVDMSIPYIARSARAMNEEGERIGAWNGEIWLGRDTPE